MKILCCKCWELASTFALGVRVALFMACRGCLRGAGCCIRPRNKIEKFASVLSFGNANFSGAFDANFITLASSFQTRCYWGCFKKLDLGYNSSYQIIGAVIGAMIRPGGPAANRAAFCALGRGKARRDGALGAAASSYSSLGVRWSGGFGLVGPWSGPNRPFPQG